MKIYLWLIVAIIILNSCSFKTNISEIRNNPRDFVDTEVTIDGKVSDYFSFGFVSYLLIKDATDSIYVITEKPRPNMGNTITITGTVAYYTLGTTQVLAILEG